jgi:hypothetical protein
MKNQGLPDYVFDGRPVIGVFVDCLAAAPGKLSPQRMFTSFCAFAGIANTFSELTPCNAHFRDIAERVKRGVWEAGACCGIS